MARNPWRNVAQALTARQRELGLSQQDLVARSGVSAATVRKLQTGEVGGFRGQTLARISEALDWPPNALTVVLEGGAPPTGARAGRGMRRREARLAALAARLAPHELRAVERLVEELVKGPADAPSGAGASP